MDYHAHTENDRKSELSQAYLLTVCAMAGVACQLSGPAIDKLKIDASLRGKSKSSASPRKASRMLIQLKSTSRTLKKHGTKLAYELDDIDLYNAFRESDEMDPSLLVVLVLPEDKTDWVSITATELLLKKCAYWVSLSGAPETANTKSIVIYIPEDQILSPDNLSTLMARQYMEEPHPLYDPTF